jgi:putrescine aminotransferase
MTFAKGVTSGYVPLGGVMVGDRVAKVLIEQGRRVRPRLHLLGPPGGLRGGAGQHQADPASWKLVEHVHDDVGPYLAEAYAQLADHPLVGDAETCGLMGALLLVKDKATGTPFDPSWRSAWSAAATASATG